MITFVVSGEEEIRPVVELVRRGNLVVHDDEVSRDAHQVLANGERYVVVAHGQADGTVLLYRSQDGQMDWIWIAMERPPVGATVYFYSCHAGELLVPALQKCQAFGHVDQVPIPSGKEGDVVLEFLTLAAEIVANTPYDRLDWQKRLITFLDNAQQRDANDMYEFVAIHMLRRSLRFGHPLWP